MMRIQAYKGARHGGSGRHALVGTALQSQVDFLIFICQTSRQLQTCCHVLEVSTSCRVK